MLRDGNSDTHLTVRLTHLLCTHFTLRLHPPRAAVTGRLLLKIGALEVALPTERAVAEDRTLRGTSGTRSEPDCGHPRAARHRPMTARRALRNRRSGRSPSPTQACA